MNSKIIMFLVILLTFTIGVYAESNGASIVITEQSYDPFPALSGRYLDLWMTVQNQSTGHITDASCQLDAKFPFYAQPDENLTKHIGYLSPNAYSTLRFKLMVSPEALDNDEEIDFKCRLNDGAAWISKKITIQVKALKPEFAIGSINTDPERLSADSTDNKITIEVQNIGNDSAKLITTQLILPKGFTSSQSYSDTANLGTIEDDSSKNAVYYIDVDKNISAGKYPAELIVNYKYTGNNGNEYKTQKINFNLDVKPEPIFEIEEVRITPNELFKGTKGEVLIKIKNIGFESADTVSMKIYTQNDQPIDFTKKYDYIGDIDEGKNGEAIFEFTIDDDASAKEYLLNAEIRYTSNEEVKISNKQFSITVSNSKPADYTIVILAAIVIVLGAGVYLWKKRK
jgi:hypothetical protein